MATVNKEQLLQFLENRVEGHIQEAIKTFQNEQTEVLLQPAPDGGWSIAQCLEHLNGYGKFYLPQIKNGLEEASNPIHSEIFKGSWVGSYLTRMMEPTTGKKKYKAFKNHIPAPDLDAHAVVAEFIHQQEELLNYLKQARRVDLDTIKLPLSITKLVKLKLGDVFQFLIAHNERHMQQAKRNVMKTFVAGNR
ncbi:DinB family protein [Adhaeribacter radiodurans]|uniref:DinB family protein n=1 Tax=Adhaeribacter radiodurans TaxID=2745197 RepID=A0A7L7L920_9BACT|nr:DinB family protein [Adhaeribacter radiodurans]QMU29326.1 DinB family protein [Adhaeribacter radiodurans]